MNRGVGAIFWGAVALLWLNGCSGQHFLQHRTNPALKEPPRPDESIALVALSADGFILADRDLFVEDLSIYPEEIHPQLLQWSNQQLLHLSAQLAHSPAPQLFPTPQEAHYAPREPHRIQQTLFLPVEWPWQGAVQRDQAETAPHLLLIPSELTIGINFRADQLYDYLLANTYTEPTGDEPQFLTAVIGWTLWDNQLQQYRRYGVADAALPLQRPITFEQLQALYNALFATVVEQSGLQRKGGEK